MKSPWITRLFLLGFCWFVALTFTPGLLSQPSWVSFFLGCAQLVSTIVLTLIYAILFHVESTTTKKVNTTNE